MTRFCIICGRESDKLYDNMCRECYIANHRLLELPERITVMLCPMCLSYKFRDRWRKPRVEGPEELLDEALRQTIKAKMKVRAIRLDRVDYEIVSGLHRISAFRSGKLKVRVRARGTCHPELEPYEDTYLIEVEVLWRLCPLCFKTKAGVEEATLQIRAEDREIDEREKVTILNLIESFIERMERESRRPAILEYEEDPHSGGIDLKFASKRAAYALASLLQRELLATVKVSSKVIGMKQGREVTRETIVVRLPPFKIGDVIIHQGKVLLVYGIRQGRVHALDLRTQRIVLLRASELRNVRRAEYERVRGMIISVQGDTVQVMRLDNYEVVEVAMQSIPSWVKEGEGVDLIEVEGQRFIARGTYGRPG